MRDALINNCKFLVYDMEMTGLDPEEDEIVEIASIPLDGSSIREELGFFTQVNTFADIKPDSKKVHGITNSRYSLSQKPMLDSVLPQFLNQANGRILVGQRPRMDLDFLQNAGKYYAVMVPKFQIIDISSIFLFLFPGSDRHNLDEIAVKMGFHRRSGHHNAWDDAVLSAKIFSRMIYKLRGKHITLLKDLLRVGRII